jgi:hypothetical protein
MGINYLVEQRGSAAVRQWSRGTAKQGAVKQGSCALRRWGMKQWDMEALEQ